VIAARPTRLRFRRSEPPDNWIILPITWKSWSPGQATFGSTQPGRQAARGEWIYFLDDDSIVSPGNLRRALRLLNDPAVKMVAARTCVLPRHPDWNRCLPWCWPAGWPWAQPRPVCGHRADARDREKELILCNLMARRNALLELGGFNEALYPNEKMP